VKEFLVQSHCKVTKIHLMESPGGLSISFCPQIITRTGEWMSCTCFMWRILFHFVDEFKFRLKSGGEKNIYTLYT